MTELKPNTRGMNQVSNIISACPCRIIACFWNQITCKSLESAGAPSDRNQSHEQTRPQKFTAIASGESRARAHFNQLPGERGV